MPLISNYKNVNTEGWTEEQVKNLSEFCFPMMTIGMGKISDETIDEVYFRFRLRERLGISSFIEKLDPRKFFSMLQSYKGLDCNISQEKRHVWINRMVKTIVHGVEYEGTGDGDVIR